MYINTVNIRTMFYSYEILNEAIDRMTDISVHLCQVMCLPQRDYVEGATKPTALEDTHSPSSSASPGNTCMRVIKYNTLPC